MERWPPQLRGDASDVGFAARFCFCGLGFEQFALGAAPILKGIAGSAVALEIDFIRALGDIFVRRRLGCSGFLRLGCSSSGLGHFSLLLSPWFGHSHFIRTDSPVAATDYRLCALSDTPENFDAQEQNFAWNQATPPAGPAAPSLCSAGFHASPSFPGPGSITIFCSI